MQSPPSRITVSIWHAVSACVCSSGACFQSVVYGGPLRAYNERVAAPTTPVTRRLQWLDSVRGIAALTVLVEHFVGIRFESYNAGWRHAWHFGFGAVVAFLLVSGYVIPLTLERSNNLGRFWRSRVFRLYPLFVIALALAIGMHLTGHPNVGDENFRENLAKNTAFSLTMLNGVFHIPFAHGPSWSLTVEMAFYLITSGLFAVGLHRRSVPLALSAVGAFLVLVFSGVDIQPGLVLAWATPFVGVLFYRCHSAGLPSRVVWGVFAAMIAAIAAVAWALPAQFGEMTGAASGYALFAIFFALPGLGTRLLAWLGEISYSVYMLHIFVVYALPRAWEKFPVLYNPWLSLPLAIAVTILVSWLSYRFIETPMNKLGKRSAGTGYSAPLATEPAT
jgi:peptidoglycan/LPS O-acetylase OafA/YrhL